MSEYRWPFKLTRNLIERGGSAAWSHVLRVDVVPTTEERIVPPAGEDYAFTVQHYRRTVEIYVSPTGRSVQVFVDGVRINLPERKDQS